MVLPCKTGHFGDVLPSQSLGVVLKKLNRTQQKQTSGQSNLTKISHRRHNRIRQIAPMYTPHASVGPSKSTTQAASRSVQPLLHMQLTVECRRACPGNQHSSLRTVHVCAYRCAQLSSTQHRTALIIFSLILQIIITANMMSTGGGGGLHAASSVSMYDGQTRETLSAATMQYMIVFTAHSAAHHQAANRCDWINVHVDQDDSVVPAVRHPFNGLFLDDLRKPAPERLNQSGF